LLLHPRCVPSLSIRGFDGDHPRTGYTKLVERAGSILQQNEDLEVSRNDKKILECLTPFH
jgi:hypothetical protein